MRGFDESLKGRTYRDNVSLRAEYETSRNHVYSNRPGIGEGLPSLLLIRPFTLDSLLLLATISYHPRGFVRFRIHTFNFPRIKLSRKNSKAVLYKAERDNTALTCTSPSVPSKLSPTFNSLSEHGRGLLEII